MKQRISSSPTSNPRSGGGGAGKSSPLARSTSLRNVKDEPQSKRQHNEQGYVAPLKVPMRRRMQTFALFLWILALPTAAVVTFSSAMITLTAIVALPYLGDAVPYAPLWNLAFTIWAMLLGAYGAHVYFDRRWRKDGAKSEFFTKNHALRRLFGVHFRDYFPASCIFDHEGPGVSGTNGDDQLFVEKYFVHNPDDYDNGLRRFSAEQQDEREQQLRQQKMTKKNNTKAGSKKCTDSGVADDDRQSTATAKNRAVPARGTCGRHPHRSLLFCGHPHGLFGFGVWCTFVTPDGMFHHLVSQRLQPKDGDENERSLSPSRSSPTAAAATSPSSTTGGANPGLDGERNKKNERRVFEVRGHTMSMNFYFPVWREFLMCIGFLDVQKSTLLHRLGPRYSELNDSEHPPPIRCSALVPGGAEESVDCCRDTLTLKNRKGFVRVALETGASLVPCYTFGETRLYRPLVNPGATARFLHKLQKVFKVGTPLVCGRGVFNYRIGMIPHRVPIVTVIGKPIEVPLMKKGQYTDEDVDRIHQQYIEAIKDLYARHVKRYGHPKQPATLGIR